MTLNCQILDDDAMARELLKQYCQKTPFLETVSVCDNAQTALGELTEKKIDLVFLDVEMPEFNGIDFLNQAPMLPMIIFTTSKKEYAFEAFEFEAVDYLVKPFNYPRFRKAAEKASLKITENGENSDYQTTSKEVYIKIKGRLIRLPVDEILYFENVADYVRIKMINGQHLIYSTLKSIAAKLPQDKFIRVHRTYIVNLNKIVDIEENTLVIERTVIPIGKAHKSSLMSKLLTL